MITPIMINIVPILSVLLPSVPLSSVPLPSVSFLSGPFSKAKTSKAWAANNSELFPPAIKYPSGLCFVG